MTGEDAAPSSVRRLRDDDWEALRAVRLAALGDSPEAFGGSLAEEGQLDEAAWRERLGASAWFAAFADGAPCGVACGGQLREPVEGMRMLRAMWVSPAHRGGGTATRLVDEVVGWARGDGASRLSLWATQRAVRARAFYERYGFVATGEVAEMRHGDHPEMSRYILEL